MAYFSLSQKVHLARSLMTRNAPLYVQYYITARCNMACEQCNIIYANSDVPEVNTEQIRAIAANLREIGVCVVLLIGGEPFIRKDLAEIIRIFIEHGIHVRMQTNGLASRERLRECVAAGGKDISISLDTLDAEKQDTINGRFKDSFEKMMRCVSDVNEIFPEDGTAFFGTVMMPRNFMDIPKVIRFATAIGWGVSLVPVHVSSACSPRGFMSYDESLLFPRSTYAKVAETLNECRRLRASGFNLYDSDEYLDDVYRFVTGEPIQWRRKNGGVCDSPNLYFAIEPNGNLAPCCDYRLNAPLPTWHPDFPKWFRERIVHEHVRPFTTTCGGCMYGSYPEMSITARFLKPMIERAKYFNSGCAKLKPMRPDELMELAARINRGENPQ